MVAYLILYGLVTLGVVFSSPNPFRRRLPRSLLLFLGAIGLMIGLRFKVGGDWNNYAVIFRFAPTRKFDDIVTQSEAAFHLLNWWISSNDGQIWMVNLVCAILFVIGLGLFARTQPDPWLVVAAATPYLIVVVAMGYSRQAVAIGLLLAGLADFFRKRSSLRFAAYIVIAALFHRTAIVAFPIVALANPRNRLINAAIALSVSYFLWDVFMSDAIGNYVKNYVDAGYSSQGAAIRIAMSAVAAVIMIVSSGRLGFVDLEARVWRNFAFVTVALVVALGLSPSSTAVDRIALYVLPLQIAVFGRVPALFRNWKTGRLAVLGIEGALLFGWLNFAVHARYWLPYRTIAFG